MEWKRYWEHVVRRYNVMIEGWSDTVPFKNLSEQSVPLHDLEELLQRWRDGRTHWKQLTEEEFDDLDKERKKKIEAGQIEAPALRKRRSDTGKHHSKRKPEKPNAPEDEQPRRSTKKYKSAETVDSEDEASNAPLDGASSDGTPAMTSASGEAAESGHHTPHSTPSTLTSSMAWGPVETSPTTSPTISACSTSNGEDANLATPTIASASGGAVVNMNSQPTLPIFAHDAPTTSAIASSSSHNPVSSTSTTAEPSYI